MLAALHAGVEAGDDEAARELLRGADWVLRGPAQRELSRALIDAAMISGQYATSEREAVRHIHRVAALNLAGRYEVDATNRGDVAAAYDELVPQPLSRTPVATIGAASGLAVLVLLLTWLAVTIRTPVRPKRPEPPLVTGAFFHGGTPARDLPLEQYIVAELTELVIETDADRRGSSEGAPRKKHALELRSSPVIARRGPALAKAWREMIDSLDRWADVPRRPKALKNAEQDLGRRTQDVSDRFAALGLGIYLQADVMIDRGSAHAAIFVFAVEDVAFVRAGGQPRRVLGLRRLDELNLRHTLLGRQGDELGDPVLLLDQIDEFVANRVLPTLDGHAYPLGDGGWRNSINGRMLAFRAGEAIRGELAAAIGPELASNPTAARPHVAKIITASVRRHEARHGIDHDRETPLRYPAALAAYVPNDGGTLAMRARAELAGYLSQIGTEPVTPHFALWNLASLSFNRERWHSAESYVGVVVIEGLARQFGFGSNVPVVIRDQLDRPRLTALAEQLTAQSSENLRVAARKLWIELYGEPMLPITDLLR